MYILPTENMLYKQTIWFLQMWSSPQWSKKVGIHNMRPAPRILEDGSSLDRLLGHPKGGVFSSELLAII